MTINKQEEKKMAIVWFVLAVFNLIPAIVNIISNEWLDFILFLNITMLCINLALKHSKVYRISEEIEEDKSPWISVEERLPETTDEFGRSEDVLILDENGWRTVAMYCIPENKWYLSVGEIQGDCEYPFEITHWMPIPKLQEE